MTAYKRNNITGQETSTLIYENEVSYIFIENNPVVVVASNGTEKPEVLFRDSILSTFKFLDTTESKNGVWYSSKEECEKTALGSCNCQTTDNETEECTGWNPL